MQNNHRSVVLWFTGLSGSGKSTMAHALEEYLQQQCLRTVVLDGDNVRQGLCSDLSFSEIDRRENIRRIGEVAKLFIEAGVIVLAPLISPYRIDREKVRALFDKDDFIEIYCDSSVEECEKRDVKGLYKKARTGEISNFTGISSPYEVPAQPEIALPTSTLSIDDCLKQIISVMVLRGVFKN